MQKTHKQTTIYLLIAIGLTFGITLIKAGALAWVSLIWAAMCCLTFTFIVIFIKPTALSKNSFKARLSIFLPAVFFLLFQLWALSQALLFSPDKHASVNSSLIGIGYTALLSVWFYCVSHPKALNWLYLCIVSFTIIQTIYGLWIFFSNTDLLLWMPKLYYLDRPTGFFVNANHFAAYLTLCLILVLSNLIASINKNKRVSKKDAQKTNFLISLFEFLYSPKLIIVGLLVLTLIASKSIGAIIALMTVLAIMFINIVRQSPYKSWLISALISITALSLIGFLLIDYALIEDEILGLAHTFSRRYELTKTAFLMLQEHWFIGIGGGAFYSQFSQFRTLGIGNTFYNYAHNDLLQFWIEYGLVGVSLLALFIGAIIRDNITILKTTKITMQKTFAYASIYSIIAVTVHSLVDFPLHIPGFSVLFLVIISINSLHIMSTTLTHNVDN